MDVRTDIENRLPNRPATAVMVSVGSIDAALHLTPIAACGIRFDSIDLAEIFKKTPPAADSKPGSRHVAKDMYEIAGRGFSAAVAGALNVKLTGVELAKHETKWKARETHQRSGAPWKYAQQTGPVVDGAVSRPGEAHEKQCHADI